MKTTARPTQSDDLTHGSAVFVSSTLETGHGFAESDAGDLSETQAWAKSPSKWDQDTGLEFRVRRDGQPTRRLRLAGARYTLGSGVGCSIRLDDPSLRPLHAVLIRDHERVLVRAYSVPFQVNGVRITEGTLELNDRLRLGNYEFELLANTPLARPPRRPSKAKTSKPQPILDEQPRRTTEPQEFDDPEHWQKAFHDEAKHWRALKHDVERREQWCRTREREVAEQREQLDRQMELFQKRQDELATQESAALEVHDEFTQRYEALRRRQTELELQKEELETGREHLRLQQDRLDGRDRLHRRQIEKLLGEQERFKQIDSAQKQLIAETEERLRRSHERADAANSAVAQMRAKFASLNEQLMQLTEQQATLQKLEAQRNREHQLRCDALAGSRDEALAQCNEIARQRDEEIDARARSEARYQKSLFKCHELEGIEEQLRAEIDLLQDEITAARGDAVKLDNECHEARETIAQLESSIRSNERRHENDRDSWTLEVESLRKNVDELTVELAGAQAQLSRLREENDRLAEQLSGAHLERDDARQKQEAAAQECAVANQLCRETKAELESANERLVEATTQYESAKQERDEIDQQRLHIQEELIASKEQAEQWERHVQSVDLRYADAQSLLTEARDQWQKAEHARDDAETSRAAAERKLADAQRELEAMQQERDEAVSEQENLRRQRDDAQTDAQETRRLYDRSNRDHDNTLERIETLERKTRETIEQKKKLVDELAVEESNEASVTFGLIHQDTDLVEDTSPIQDASPTYETSPVPESDPVDLGVADELRNLAEATPRLLDEEETTDGDEVQPPTQETAAESRGHVDNAFSEDSAVLNDDDDVWPTYSVQSPADESFSDMPLDVKRDTETVEPGEPVPSDLDSSASWSDESFHTPQNFDEPQMVHDPQASHEPATIHEPATAREPQWPDEDQSCLRPDERLPLDSLPSWNEPAGDQDAQDGSIDADESPSPMWRTEADLEVESAAADDESLGDRLIREMGIAQHEANNLEDDADDDLDTARPEMTAMFNGPFENSFHVSANDDVADADNDEANDFSSPNITTQWQPAATLEPEPTLDDQDDASADSPFAAMLSATAESRLQDGAKSQDQQQDVTPNSDASWPDSSGTGLPSVSQLFSEAEEVVATDSMLVSPESQSEDSSATGNETIVEMADAAPLNDESSEEPDDDSIEAYMNRLLQRVQGSPESAIPAKATPASATKSSKPSSESTETATPKSVAPVSSMANHASSSAAAENESSLDQSDVNRAVEDDGPLIPRSQAPERNSNLSAMRELANESARSAITRSNRSQSHTTRVQAMLKFIYAGVALLCGLVAVAMIDLTMLKMVAVIAAMIAAAVFVKEGFELMTDLSSRTQATAANEDAEPVEPVETA